MNGDAPDYEEELKTIAKGIFELEEQINRVRGILNTATHKKRQLHKDFTRLYEEKQRTEAEDAQRPIRA